MAHYRAVAAFLLLLALLFLAGCLPKTRGPTVLPLTLTLPAEGLSVQVALAGGGPVTQGQTVQCQLTLTNVSNGPVVVGEAEARLGRSSAGHAWRERVYGSVTYDAAADAYYLNELAQMEATAADWTTGLLLPGESAACALTLQVLDAGEVPAELRLLYYAGAFEEMAQRLFFERERNGFEVTYGRANAEELRALPSAEGPLLWRRVAIHRPLSAPLIGEAQTTVRVAPAAFTPEQAMARAGLTTSRYAYSREHGAWLLEGAERVVVVTPSRARSYPGFTLPVWQFVEAAEDRVYFWYLQDEKALHALFRPYDFQEGIGFHADVPKRLVAALLARAHEAGYLAVMSEFQFTPCISFVPRAQGPSG